MKTHGESGESFRNDSPGPSTSWDVAANLLATIHKDIVSNDTYNASDIDTDTDNDEMTQRALMFCKIGLY